MLVRQSVVHASQLGGTDLSKFISTGIQTFSFLDYLDQWELVTWKSVVLMQTQIFPWENWSQCALFTSHTKLHLSTQTLAKILVPQPSVLLSYFPMGLEFEQGKTVLFIVPL